MVAFILMWHTQLKLFHLNPRLDMVMPIFNIMCWMLASPRLNLNCQSEQMSHVKQQHYNTAMVFVQLSSRYTSGEENCHRMIPLGYTCFVTKGASTSAFHFGPGVHFWSESSKWPCLLCPTMWGSLRARKPNSFVWNQTRWCGLGAPAANGDSVHRSMLALVSVNLWHAVTWGHSLLLSAQCTHSFVCLFAKQSRVPIQGVMGSSDSMAERTREVAWKICVRRCKRFMYNLISLSATEIFSFSWNSTRESFWKRI